MGYPFSFIIFPFLTLSDLLTDFALAGICELQKENCDMWAIYNFSFYKKHKFKLQTFIKKKKENRDAEDTVDNNSEDYLYHSLYSVLMIWLQ